MISPLPSISPSSSKAEPTPPSGAESGLVPFGQSLREALDGVVDRDASAAPEGALTGVHRDAGEAGSEVGRESLGLALASPVAPATDRPPRPEGVPPPLAATETAADEASAPARAPAGGDAPVAGDGHALPPANDAGAALRSPCAAATSGRVDALFARLQVLARALRPLAGPRLATPALDPVPARSGRELPQPASDGARTRGTAAGSAEPVAIAAASAAARTLEAVAAGTPEFAMEVRDVRMSPAPAPGAASRGGSSGPSRGDVPAPTSTPVPTLTTGTLAAAPARTTDERPATASPPAATWGHASGTATSTLTRRGMERAPEPPSSAPAAIAAPDRPRPADGSRAEAAGPELGTVTLSRATTERVGVTAPRLQVVALADAPASIPTTVARRPVLDPVRVAPPLPSATAAAPSTRPPAPPPSPRPLAGPPPPSRPLTERASAAPTGAGATLVARAAASVLAPLLERTLGRVVGMAVAPDEGVPPAATSADGQAARIATASRPAGATPFAMPLADAEDAIPHAAHLTPLAAALARGATTRVTTRVGTGATTRDALEPPTVAGPPAAEVARASVPATPTSTVTPRERAMPAAAVPARGDVPVADRNASELHATPGPARDPAPVEARSRGREHPSIAARPADTAVAANASPEGAGPSVPGVAPSAVTPGSPRADRAPAVPAGDAARTAVAEATRFEGARPRDHVTLRFAGEDGLEGRLRVVVRGGTVVATVSADDPAMLKRLGEGLGDLHRALREQGFTETRVVLQPGREAAAEPTRGSRDPAPARDDGRPRERATEHQDPDTRQERGGRRGPKRGEER